MKNRAIALNRAITLGLFLSVLAGGSAHAAESTVPGGSVTATSGGEQSQLKCAERAEMGTPFRICVYAKQSELMNVGFDLDRAFKKLKTMNDWMSDWQPETQLSRVNKSAGIKPEKVGQELFDLLKYTFEVSAKTEGAFDPTFNAFWGLYNFKPGQEREPTDSEIKERLPLIDWRSVELNEKDRTVFLKKTGMKLGLGALGQGYGVDHVIEDLKKNYSAGFVDGSGDTAFWGKKPDGSLWVTGIRDPRDKNKTVMRIYGTDFAITTSGDDEKFFMRGDRRVHHIIDPKTGKPATASRQVTVIAKRALDADAFDTGVFVMGPAKGKRLIEAQGYQAVFVSADGVTMTKGLKKKTTPWGEVFEVEGELK